ncbi:SMI1/KNR4 family protein [Xanthomonas oryzae]|nr:SMI1/KNR4 family protein [Xanthomonas oryzae]QBG85282.1 SMI1/KNR4 family protein [Xanthomonas oryzae]
MNAYPWHLPKVAATAEDIKIAEKAVGLEFSSQYKDFLRCADGWQGFT